MDSGPASARTDDNSTQERILRAAYDCFEQYGIGKTTIENIASRAKVSRPTVYKYYPSKDAILDEISVRETWRVNSEVRRRLVRSDDFADFLSDTLLLVIRLANENIYIRRMVESIEFQESVISPSSLMQQLQRTWWANMFEQARARGHRLLAIVPNKIPLEKKILLKIAGADLEVISDELCPAPGLGDGSINLAKTHAKASAKKYAMPNQYENAKNVEAHFKTTGPEIWKQTEGKITHLFTSLGTCGTVTGTAKFLREKNPRVKIIAVQPTEGHDVPGLRNVSQLGVSKLFDASLVDDIIEVDFQLAYTRALELCQNEGLLAGPSSGLIFEGALEIVRRDKNGHGVMIFPDNIFKYTSNMVKHIPGLGSGTKP